jgi:hypothetical protein
MCKNLIFNISMSMIIGVNLGIIDVGSISAVHHDNYKHHSFHNYERVLELDFDGGGVSVRVPLCLSLIA